MAHREGPEFRELETGREREAWRQIKTQRQWMETSRLKRWRNRGGEALRPTLPPRCPSSLPRVGGQGLMLQKGHLSPWKQQKWGRGARPS